MQEKRADGVLDTNAPDNVSGKGEFIIDQKILVKAGALAEELAKEASIRILESFRTSLSVESKKNASDVVSELDRELEQLVKEEVIHHFPEHDFLGEEFGRESKNSEWMWVLDPIDGTQNYVKGLPISCFSLAISFRGTPVYGVITDPFYGEIYSAMRGKGGKCNGEKIHVKNDTSLKGSLILMELENGHPWFNFEQTLRSLAKAEASSRILGSTALTLAHIASGRADGSIHGSMKPWDVAVGILLVEEAGGIVRNWNGKAYRLFEGGGLISGPKPIVDELLSISKKLKIRR